MELGIFTRVFQEQELEQALLSITSHPIKNIEITANNKSKHLDLERHNDEKYITHLKSSLDKYNISISNISIHRDTQLILGPHGDATHIFFKGNNSEQVEFGIQRAKLAADMARSLNVNTVVGLLGCSDFSQWYSWPSKDGWYKQVEAAKQMWIPILEYYDRMGVRFAHEIGLQQIAYNLETALEINDIFDCPNFGFCIDPANLQLVGVDACQCIEILGNKVFHFHAKDIEITASLSKTGWMPHGDLGRVTRGLRFRIPGWGDMPWKKILTSLGIISYSGPISLEIEDFIIKEPQVAIKKSIEYLEPLLF